MEKYRIKEKEKEEQEVSREEYLRYDKKAGHFMGDFMLPRSFYDDQHDIFGYIKEK